MCAGIGNFYAPGGGFDFLGCGRTAIAGEGEDPPICDSHATTPSTTATIAVATTAADHANSISSAFYLLLIPVTLMIQCY